MAGAGSPKCGLCAGLERALSVRGLVAVVTLWEETGRGVSVRRVGPGRREERYKEEEGPNLEGGNPVAGSGSRGGLSCEGQVWRLLGP